MMDPQQTLADMLNALNRNEYDEASELAAALLEWLRKGGFPPIVVGEISLDIDWHREIACFICRCVTDRINRERKAQRQRTLATAPKGEH